MKKFPSQSKLMFRIKERKKPKRLKSKNHQMLKDQLTKKL